MKSRQRYKDNEIQRSLVLLLDSVEKMLPIQILALSVKKQSKAKQKSKYGMALRRRRKLWP